MRNLLPTLKIRTKDDLKGSAAYFSIIIILTVTFTIVLPRLIAPQTEGSFSMLGFASSVYILVVAINSLRQYLRLCIQNGTGRKTMFTGHIISGVVLAAFVALADEIILFLAQICTKGTSNIYISDVYYLLYRKEGFINADTAIPFSDRLLSIMTVFGIFFCVYTIGSFISALLYRLPKPWNLVVGFGLPFIIVNGIPALGIRSDAFYQTMTKLIKYLMSAPVHLFIIMMIVSAIFVVLNWITIRRIPIKTPQG